MPIYFLWGDEDYLIEKRAKEIRNKALKGDVNELNYKTADNPSFPMFSELIRTNAMMFGDLVIQIKCNRYFLETKDKQKLEDNEVKELVDGLNNISDSVHLILICPTPKQDKKKAPDSRKKLYKELIKLTTPEEFKAYRNYETDKIYPEIKKIADEKKIKINKQEAELLIQTTGASLRDIDNQLEKLKLYAHPKDLITADMIRKVAVNNVDIYAIIDFILSKNQVKAIDGISQLLQKEHYLPILSLFQTTISNLIRTKVYLSNRMSSMDIASRLNSIKFVVEKNIEKLENIDFKELVDLKINLLRAEYELKTGSIKDPITAFELAFMGNFEGAKDD